ncbi:sulfur relay protein DsrH [Microbulbifer agarilyticus]|uniref:Sulfur relay protein DsrH n=1 Tax=Microbulbifer agarilyticus TaxID=260552 RepID=A0A1Q2M539_9GAMM|nr:sulfurtransferase complex subunit TusB [Microbulbifer agarilyticus]AQQ67766.1 sulfur relay protein DsrH [Microbulbifer agarilyticus]
MTLHIVNQSPLGGSALHDCLASFAEGDALLLIEDAVYAANAPTHHKLPQEKIYALAADAQARGVTLAQSVTAIDEEAWVDLCVTHTPIVSWFR